MAEWFDGYFDHEYLYLWEESEAAGNAHRQSAGLWSILDVQPEFRVLDAPCSYGRISGFSLNAVPKSSASIYPTT